MSDISPALKYIIENNLHWSNFRHVFYLDIEVEVDKKDIEGSRPERADQKITSICIYSNFLNKYLFFS